jgi:hypothetical protein
MFCSPTENERSLEASNIFGDIPLRKSLYTNTVFRDDGTRETIAHKMFCSPTEDERSLDTSNIFRDIP